MVTKRSFDTVPVYSTQHGRLCPGCGRPTAECQCPSRKSPQASDGIVRVGRQTKGRKGSGVTTVTGLDLAEEQLRQLAGKLKKQCGAGGAIKNGIIEIQGEHRDTLVSALRKLGYTVKRVGG